uniref:RNase III domain-containing protein n=1 Tax=viral metagenome TaxID=1070528 RepID=A0A6C0CGF2_9ZZZZ
MDKPDPKLAGFLAKQKNGETRYKDFREYIHSLLSTFLPEEYLRIYMSEEVEPLKPRPKEYAGIPEIEREPLGIKSDREIGKGPFFIIQRAFMHEFLSNINLETLETLGDVILNESVVMIITTCWPNLLKEAGQVADMKKFYTNNANAAIYAEKLGFLDWVVRLEKQGLNSKERADVFESFLGALAMIGEFYIGEQMGLAIARLFLNKFLSTEKWYPEDPRYYETPATLWNDFISALPPDVHKPIKVEIFSQDDGEDDDDKMWHFTVTVRDRAGDSNGLIKKKTNPPVSFLKFFAKARNQDDAKTAAFKELAAALNLSRADINTMRIKKRESNAALKGPLNRLAELEEEQKREFQVPARKPRGGQTFVFVEEIRREQVNGKMLTIKQTVAQGMGIDEKTALEEAVNNIATGKEFETVAGTGFEIINPDEQPIVASERPATAPRTQAPKTQSGKSRGTSQPRSRQTSSARGKPKPESRTYTAEEYFSEGK